MSNLEASTRTSCPLALASTGGLIYQVTAIVVVLAVVGMTHREAGSYSNRSRKDAACGLLFILARAVSCIWRMRSRVTSKRSPTSSRVLG
jgi:hypothetical protein